MGIMGIVPQEMSPSVEKYSLSYIRARHREIARLLVLGYTQADIARHIGMTQGRLSIIVNSPLFKVLVAELEEGRNDSVVDIRQQCLDLSPAALAETTRIMMTSPSEELRLKASKDILDRAGVHSKTPLISINVGEHTPVDIEKYRMAPAPTETPIECEVEEINENLL